MKIELPIRIVVSQPVAGVVMKMQKGRDELVPPVAESANELIFEFSVTVDMSAAEPNFLGKFAQGPKDVRFVYINSGQAAGQMGVSWQRRAKISLMSISRQQIEEVAVKNDLIIMTEINGVARDGGPVCASVKMFEWKVAAK
jgi:hypothetical protein